MATAMTETSTTTVTTGMIGTRRNEPPTRTSSIATGDTGECDKDRKIIYKAMTPTSEASSDGMQTMTTNVISIGKTAMMHEL